MKLLKRGNKEFKDLFSVKIYKCKCNVCGAEFEAQEGEIFTTDDNKFVCPSCLMYHNDFQCEPSRTEEVDFFQVVNYDTTRNPKRTIEIPINNDTND